MSLVRDSKRVPKVLHSVVAKTNSVFGFITPRETEGKLSRKHNFNPRHCVQRGDCNISCALLLRPQLIKSAVKQDTS